MWKKIHFVTSSTFTSLIPTIEISCHFSEAWKCSLDQPALWNFVIVRVFFFPPASQFKSSPNFVVIAIRAGYKTNQNSLRIIQKLAISFSIAHPEYNMACELHHCYTSRRSAVFQEGYRNWDEQNIYSLFLKQTEMNEGCSVPLVPQHCTLCYDLLCTLLSVLLIFNWGNIS